ncbi:MAG: hypothetical protein A2Y41_12585 [Spirochaetes bacterium GWB1_36_13]|nr:MAG: hypothetical protein A2Y41_12585 [Spirochaetes bacterium GWB1_36_13]
MLLIQKNKWQDFKDPLLSRLKSSKTLTLTETILETLRFLKLEEKDLSFLISYFKNSDKGIRNTTIRLFSSYPETEKKLIKLFDLSTEFFLKDALIRTIGEFETDTTTAFLLENLNDTYYQNAILLAFQKKEKISSITLNRIVYFFHEYDENPIYIHLFSLIFSQLDEKDKTVLLDLFSNKIQTSEDKDTITAFCQALLRNNEMITEKTKAALQHLSVRPDWIIQKLILQIFDLGKEN